MWTRTTLARTLPEIRIAFEPDASSGFWIAYVWEVTPTATRLRLLTGTRLRETWMGSTDVVRQLNKHGYVVVPTWTDV